MNLYGIYNQLTNFLEDGSPRQPESQIGTKINEIKQKIFTRPPEPTQNQQQQNTFWGKVEQKFDELRRPSPIRQQQNVQLRQPSPISVQSSIRDNKRKIFEQQQPESVPTRKQWETKLNDSISDSFTSQSIRSIENEDTNVDEMYYKENNQEQILSVLIKKLGPNEKQNNLHQMNQKLGFLLENLTKKEKNAVKQLTINLLAHQNELNRAQSNFDQMVNRFNQCFRRVQVARSDLSKLKKTHCELGIGIQNKLRRKKEMELQIQNIRTFCQQHQNVKDLIEQLNHQNIDKQQWPLKRVLQVKDEVWKASKQNTNMRFYTCFNDIRGHIEGLFQQQLDFSFRFFTQNIIEVSLQYQNEQIFQILDNICDYLVQYELNNKQVDISKHIKTSIQAQFRSILRQSGTWNKKIERLRNIKFDSIKNLNQYLNAFFISFYKTSYGLNRIVYVFQQLAGNNKLQDKQKCSLYKKVSFQFGIEKNQFWTYIQDKLIKTLKRTKLDGPTNSNDWQRLEFILYRIIQIGEELSNLKSDSLLNHISNQLQSIAIGISKSVYQCLSSQKGVGMIKIQSANYEMTLFKRIDDFKKRKRIDSKSGYLQQYLNAKEIIKEPQLQILPTAENQIYTKKEEYYFIISQLQEFILFGQSVPQLQLDCFIYSLQCTQFYSYLLMVQNLGHHLKQLIIDIQIDKYKDQIEFTQLIQAHDWVCEYGKYSHLRQMIAQQYDAVKSYGMNVEVQYIASSLREIIENLNLLQKIHDYIQNEFKPQIPEDKELFNNYLKKQQDLIGEIISLWIFQQGLKDIQIDGTQLQSYQLISKLNQVMHQIQKSNQVIESKISTEILINIYLQAFNRQLAVTLSKVIEKTNKLQIIAELKNFFRLNPYKQKFDSLETILEVKNQSQIFDAMIKAKDIPLSLQMQILQREFNLSCIYIKRFYENYYNFIIDII